MSRIIIGVDDHEGSQDAVAFGAALTRDSGAPVTVAHAYPRQQHGFAAAYKSDQFQQRQHLGAAGAYGNRGLPLGGVREAGRTGERTAAWTPGPGAKNVTLR